LLSLFITRTRRLGAAGLLAALAGASGCSVPDAPAPGAAQPSAHRSTVSTAPASSAAAPGSTAPSSTAAAVPPSARASCDPAAVLGTWSTARRAAQLVFAPADEDDVLAARPMVEAGAGGLLLFGSAAPADLPRQLAALRRDAPGGLPPLVTTDEEGGEIQRMANLAGNLPWPRAMAATMTPAQVQALAKRVGRRMRAAGITMDLAPVLDLSDSPGPNATYPDGPRSFSVHPAVATAYGLAFAQGLRRGGVIPVIKHFPGLGQASANTDFGPATVPPLPVLRRAALLPFQAAINRGVPAVMVGEAAIPGLTHGLPATLSRPAIAGLLRHQLGFHGLVLTDSLSTGAIQHAGYGIPQAAVRAIAAGADMVTFDAANPPAATRAIITRLVAAVRSGQLPEARLDSAVQHVLRAKGRPVCG
jgi:beta-N-acetylhexosaminidase